MKVYDFTIGQRKGIKVSDKGLYMFKNRLKKNEIIVGREKNLEKSY